MSDDENAWVDCPNWRDRWTVVKPLPGGGQGEAFRARRKVDGRTGFLKAIRAKTDPERRARFSREANAYDTFRIGGVPVLIESNAHRHNNADIEPYIVTQFIEGSTLSQWREKQTRVELVVAIATTRALLSTLHECHAAGCVHRDIKPDNIILVDDDPGRPALLDFGLNFHETPHVSFQTEQGQEIGNRFLRLPELSAGSLLKQDPRSDLSFAAGILFYMLTGIHPDLLQDAEGRLPHQRGQSVAILHDLAGSRSARLASLFDSAFAPKIADRVTSANAMLASIDRMMADQEVGRSAEHDLAAILEIVDTQAERRRVETTAKLREALDQVQRVHTDVEQALKGAFVLWQTGLSISGEVGRNTLFWKKVGSNDTLLSTNYEAQEAGDEIIIRMSGETVFRTPIESPNYSADFQQSVKARLLARIRAAVTDPDALPPEADNFKESKPFARLLDAIDEAQRSRRRILAFVYDPTQQERSRLQYGLSNFLQNRKTRETIQSAFVVALVPLSQVSAKSNALEGLSMESSRWVVFDTNLTPLDQAVVYANPQEGERIALDLASRFGPF